MKQINKRMSGRMSDKHCIFKDVTFCHFGIYDVIVAPFNLIQLPAMSCVDAENIMRIKGYEVLDSDYSYDNSDAQSFLN